MCSFLFILLADLVLPLPDFGLDGRHIPLTMARSKQPPVKRESSSEYFNKKTASWEEWNGHDQAPTSGQATNGAVKVHATQVAQNAAQDKKDAAGAIQLVIAVAGIYASL